MYNYHRLRTFLDLQTRQITSAADFSKFHDAFKNKLVLVVGGSGLIGINLTVLLTNMGARVTSTFHSPGGEEFLRSICEADRRPVYLTHDSLIPKLGSGCFDYIFFCAGYSAPALFTKKPRGTIEANTTLLGEALHLLASKGKAIYVSSSEVYGSQYLDEDQMLTVDESSPRSIYVLSKLLGEALCVDFAHKHNREGDIKIARVSLAYGPGARYGDDRALHSFVQTGVRGEEIKLKDSGQASRAYCYVYDTIAMLLNVLIEGKQTCYNVAGTQSIKIIDLAKEIANRCNVAMRWDTSKMNLEAPVKVLTNTNLYRTEFNFNEFDLVPIQFGLDKTIEWYKLMLEKI